jgi:hypothetical protein
MCSMHKDILNYVYYIYRLKHVMMEDYFRIKLISIPRSRSDELPRDSTDKNTLI